MTRSISPLRLESPSDGLGEEGGKVEEDGDSKVGGGGVADTKQVAVFVGGGVPPPTVRPVKVEVDAAEGHPLLKQRVEMVMDQSASHVVQSKRI